MHVYCPFETSGLYQANQQEDEVRTEIALDIGSLTRASLESYDRHTYTMHTFKRLEYHRVAADYKKFYV